ncbi:Retrieval of early ER protein Rer1 [Penicillium expansum]|uniref:Copper transport protein n=1 Tax=Penicillium expansum TaxID=27334 RepID=A0A0A2IEI1_PENEN|nr:Retrieval of early ER protein Rer1 [Penicillium expansum]KGO41492.1 Retrieval of early ER protein Rer1 [Penicillium expansum]KGO62488.1 Retrieval of early ER protein Rer1 [Penicillium expansum]KGO67016.1 Retrieval of early ER protein Rer1 [Penicillium expansum]
MDVPEPDQSPFTAMSAHTSRLTRHYQAYLDASTPYTTYRWVGSGVLLLLFFLRIFLAQGWYIVAYTLGIYLLNLFLAFLTPKFDPSLTQDEGLEDGDAGSPSLPTKKDEEFRPFIRRLPEFKFWHSATRAIAIGFVCSWLAVFDIPVFWPVLVVYWIILFVLTMRRQIQHMIKYRYVPFSFGKTRATMDMDMNMPSVFSASTEITILFTGWTTSTTTQYVFTLSFLFLLAIFNRFLGALKFQLEKSWSQHNSSPSALLLAPVNPRQSIRKAKLSPLPDYMHVHGDEDPEEVTLPVSNNENETRSTSLRYLKGDGVRNRSSLKRLLPSWKASGTWSLRKDGTRGYICYFLHRMLSVMTFNVGVFVTVLFGVLVGELFLGRFSQGTSWQEGTCHGG